MVAEKKGFSLSSDRKKAIAAAMLELPAHSDVQQAVSNLKSNGLVLAALTNGVLKSARAQLKYAGLIDHFDQIISADEVKRFKPARESYAFAARRLRARGPTIRLISAHAWDIASASGVRWKTAFVKRPGTVLNPTGTKPDIQADSLTKLARKILKER